MNAFVPDGRIRFVRLNPLLGGPRQEDVEGLQVRAFWARIRASELRIEKATRPEPLAWTIVQQAMRDLATLELSPLLARQAP